MRMLIACVLLVAGMQMQGAAAESNAAPAEESAMLRTTIVDRYRQMLKEAKLWDVEGTNWAANFWRAERVFVETPVVQPAAGPKAGPQVEADLAMCREHIDAVLQMYRAKQERLAGIAEVVSSEIRTIDASERLGPDVMPANTFLMTIDDGPSAANKDAMLAALRASDVKAIFFHTGEAIYEQKVALADYVAAGHDLGNHSGRVRSGDDGTLAAIRKAFTAERTWYRAPGGSRDEVYVQAVAKNRGVHLLWNVDSRDFELLLVNPPESRSEADVRLARDRCVANAVIISLLRGRGIVLFHEVLDGGPEVVGRYLQVMKALGYTFAEPATVWTRAMRPSQNM